MFESMKNTVIQWNQRTTDRQKLQHSYVLLLVVVVFIAGVTSLFNADYSRTLMYIALAFITTLITNFVVWGLLKSSVLDKLPRQVRQTRTTRRKS
jgi:hypothetical protein